MPGHHIHTQLCTLMMCKLLLFEWACHPHAPYFFPFSCAQHHSLTQIFPNAVHCSQQLWKLDAYDSLKNFYDLTSWMMSPVLSWGYEELPWDWQERIVFGPEDASDGNLGKDWLALEEDLNMPTCLRVMTSSVVYSSRSLAMPQKSVSFLEKGPTVMKEASFPVLGSWYGAVWLWQDDYLWKKIFGELYMPLEIRRHPLWVVIAYSCSVQSCMQVAGTPIDHLWWMKLDGSAGSWMSSGQDLL